MKMKMIVALFVLVLVSLVGANTANALNVAEFIADGATAPTAQGWLQFAPVFGPGQSGSHIAANGGDPIAWQHQGSGSGGYRVNNSTANYAAVMGGADGYTVTIESKLLQCGRNCAVAKVQDGGAAGNSTIQLDFWDGTDFGDGQGPGVFYSLDGQTLAHQATRLGTVDPTDGFHKYQISMDAKGTDFATNSTDDEISIFVDDVLVVGPLARTAFPRGWEYETIIGRTGWASEGNSTIQYANFSVKSGSIVIPEPSALVLLTLGLLGLVGYRRRR